MIERRRISITGRIQGVGFRPAVYRIARLLGLSGIVYNDTKGVTVELQGEAEKIAEFLARLQSDADKPPMAEITSCDTVDIPVIESEAEFIIETSDSHGSPLSQVTADIATCRDCLAEMVDKEDFHPSGCELRAIVATEIGRTATYQEQISQQLNDVMLLDAEAHIASQAFTGEFVDHIEDSDLATVFQPVLHNVIAPDVVHILRRTPITSV